MYSFGFDKEKVKKVENDFSKIELDPETRAVITPITQILTKYISMSELAMRGFLSYAMRDYQEEHQSKVLLLNELKNQSLQEQQKYFQEFGQCVLKRLSAVLKAPEDKERLKKAIEETAMAISKLSS